MYGMNLSWPITCLRSKHTAPATVLSHQPSARVFGGCIPEAWPPPRCSVIVLGVSPLAPPPVIDLGLDAGSVARGYLEHLPQDCRGRDGHGYRDNHFPKT